MAINHHVIALPWPVIQRGGWAYDVAYAVASSLTVDDRRLWERDLLAFYLDRLHAAGGPRLDFYEAFRTYRQHMPYPYLCWLMTLVGQSSVTPDMQKEYVSMNIVERSAHAIDDLETLKAFG